jgi:hypothetical protein
MKSKKILKSCQTLSKCLADGEIGDLSKTMMTNKYEDMIAKTPKNNV